ncbi:hypothetical protein BDQ17DRAFT_1338481 [Cyathus striatus]|nr:hypothetical protein BDQ17DRAFT_1338481 [Cyathus striatus]
MSTTMPMKELWAKMDKTSYYANAKLVKLVLPASFYPRLKEDRYAVVFLPRTYEETKALALKVFGPCLNDELYLDHELILRCSVKNQQDEWYWADVMEGDWEKMVNTLAVEEIGVFFANGDSEYSTERMGSTNDKFMLGMEASNRRMSENIVDYSDSIMRMIKNMSVGVALCCSAFFIYAASTSK